MCIRDRIGVARNALVAVQFPVADTAVGAGTLLYEGTHVLSLIHILPIRDKMRQILLPI